MTPSDKPAKRSYKKKKTDMDAIEQCLEEVPQAIEPHRFNNLSPKQREIFASKIKNLLGQFMDSYMLIGFSVDGLETIIVDTHGTPLETRGLNHLAFEFFDHYFSQMESSSNILEDDDEDDD